MTVTSKEISIELKEIGFKTENFFFSYFKNEKTGEFSVRVDDQDHQENGVPLTNECRAYGLETIIDALPNSIKRGSLFHPLNICKTSVCYYESERIANPYFFQKREGETLATTAAKLLIKLIEDKIINIKGEEEDE